jgi:hypothetical protein
MATLLSPNFCVKYSKTMSDRVFSNGEFASARRHYPQRSVHGGLKDFGVGLFTVRECVFNIAAVPVTKLFAGEEGDIGGHVL